MSFFLNSLDVKNSISTASFTASYVNGINASVLNNIRSLSGNVQSQLDLLSSLLSNTNVCYTNVCSTTVSSSLLSVSTLFGQNTSVLNFNACYAVVTNVSCLDLYARRSSLIDIISQSLTVSTLTVSSVNASTLNTNTLQAQNASLTNVSVTTTQCVMLFTKDFTASGINASSITNVCFCSVSMLSCSTGLFKTLSCNNSVQTSDLTCARVYCDTITSSSYIVSPTMNTCYLNVTATQTNTLSVSTINNLNANLITYLSGLTASVQTQLNSITTATSTSIITASITNAIISTINSCFVYASNASTIVFNSAIGTIDTLSTRNLNAVTLNGYNATLLGLLSNVTSDIQSQLSTVQVSNASYIKLESGSGTIVNLVSDTINMKYGTGITFNLGTLNSATINTSYINGMSASTLKYLSGTTSNLQGQITNYFGYLSTRSNSLQTAFVNLNSRNVLLQDQINRSTSLSASYTTLTVNSATIDALTASTLTTTRFVTQYSIQNACITSASILSLNASFIVSNTASLQTLNTSCVVADTASFVNISNTTLTSVSGNINNLTFSTLNGMSSSSFNQRMSSSATVNTLMFGDTRLTQYCSTLIPDTVFRPVPGIEYTVTSTGLYTFNCTVRAYSVSYTPWTELALSTSSTVKDNVNSYYYIDSVVNVGASLPSKPFMVPCIFFTRTLYMNSGETMYVIGNYSGSSVSQTDLNSTNGPYINGRLEIVKL